MVRVCTELPVLVVADVEPGSGVPPQLGRAASESTSRMETNSARRRRAVRGMWGPLGVSGV